MSEVDLHQLANTPGAGVAEKELRSAGHWKIGASNALPEWEVAVEFTVRKRDWVPVRASSAHEAKRIAREMVFKDPHAGHEDEVIIEHVWEPSLTGL